MIESITYDKINKQFKVKRNNIYIKVPFCTISDTLLEEEKLWIRDQCDAWRENKYTIEWMKLSDRLD